MQDIKRIGLAIAFSPTAPAMLKETWALVKNFKAELVLIHVGKNKEENREKLFELLNQHVAHEIVPTVIVEDGDPVNKILQACKQEQIDLLVVGALKKEKLLKYYIGTIARKIMRKADCSLLVITNPTLEVPTSFKNIVVNAEDSPYVEDALKIACLLASVSKSPWIHVVREIKLYGLAMASFDQQSEEEYSEVRQNLLRQEAHHVERMLGNVSHSHCKINIKMLSGKSGFELVKFANSKNADLLVVGAPKQKFKLFDRVFTHDLEYVFADLPCNLLIVHPGKEAGNG
jgi:nucleotide-binding universal stress UspA family protein